MQAHAVRHLANCMKYSLFKTPLLEAIIWVGFFVKKLVCRTDIVYILVQTHDKSLCVAVDSGLENWIGW